MEPYEEIRAKIVELNIRKVAVFDDDIERINSPWYLTDATWEAFVDILGIVEEDPLNPAEMATFADLPNEERESIFEQYKDKVPVEAIEEFTTLTSLWLQEWIRILEKFDIHVDTFVNWGDFTKRYNVEASTALKQYDLFLLDHDFGKHGGVPQSTFIAQEIGKTLTTANRHHTDPIPGLIKFSAQDIEHTEQEKRFFLAKTSFPRGCYEFLPKSAIRNQFEDRFKKVLRDIKVGRSLFDLSWQTAKAISDVAAEDVLKTLFHLNRESVIALSHHQLSQEGVTPHDYFLELFLGLIRTSLSGHNDVVDATRNYVEVLSSAEETNPVVEPFGLRKVQNRYLFDYKINHFRRAIDLGDIFRFGSPSSSEIGVIITPSCDMVIRGNISTLKSKLVMLLTGKLIEKGDKNLDIDTTCFAPTETDDPNFTIQWTVKNPVILPRRILDLVALNEEGIAMLPLSGKVNKSPWWTDIFYLYMEKVCKDLKQVKHRVPHRKHKMIVIPNDEFLSVTHALGSAALYPATIDATQLTFPIQRLARLRTEESLRIQQYYHTDAARMGVITELGKREEVIQVNIKNQVGIQLGILASTVIMVGNSKSILLDTVRFCRMCQNVAGYELLVTFASEYGSQFNLQLALDSDDYKSKYSLTLSRKIYTLQPKRP